MRDERKKDLISLEKAALQELQDELHRSTIVVRLHLRHPLVENEGHLSTCTRWFVRVLFAQS